MKLKDHTKIRIKLGLTITSYIIFAIVLIKLILSIVFNQATNYIIDNNNFSDVKPMSFLILGTDARVDDPSMGARSDVMMVVTVTPNNINGNLETNIISVPRDTIIQNTCSGEYGKANSMYSYGYTTSIEEADKCTVDSIEQFLNIPIDYYFDTSFDGFINLIDAIGGVDVDVPYAMQEQDSKGNQGAIVLEQGMQTLDGESALAYVRQRHESSDYERNLRQQEVIMAIVKKIMNNPTDYLNEFLNVYKEDVHTNLDIKTISTISNTVISTFNNMMKNLSSQAPIIFDFKSSPSATSTAIGDGSDNVFGVDTSNMEPIQYADLYPDTVAKADSPIFEGYIANTKIDQFYFSKRESHFASSSAELDENGQPIEKEIKPLTIEIQNYSISSDPINGPSGWYSYVSPFNLNYTSNMLRLALGLDLEWDNFDYSTLASFGGASEGYIYYNDEQRYGVDFSGVYEKYNINPSSYDSSTPITQTEVQETPKTVEKDSDSDGVVDSQDVCSKGDDNKDTDGDGTPDACDNYPNGEDKKDADSDGVIDINDICANGDDNKDTDGDGIPDACDDYPNDEDKKDTDGDGVIDIDDICSNGDDNIDTDGDGVPDACDDDTVS